MSLAARPVRPSQGHRLDLPLSRALAAARSIVPVSARARALACGLLAASLMGAGSAAAAPQEPAQVMVQLNYDGSVPLADPDYVETLANLWYPLAKGPLSQGYPVEPLPVMVTVRGGNSNNITIGGGTPDEVTPLANDFGFLHITCNYPIVGPTEDYNVASRGLGLLVQYLRENATDLNLDPEQIMMQSRSFGTVATYRVALGENYAHPGAADPVLQQSSRPDYYAPRFGPSTLTCFSTQAGPWDSTLSTFFFPGETFDQGTPEMRLSESAYWWLLNPHLFDREHTPPLCIVYSSEHSDVCGEVTDVHSGIFGDIMLEAIDDYVAMTGDRVFGSRSGSVDTSQSVDATPGIITWAVERLAADFDGLWLAPPAGVVGPTGGTITLSVFGAVPGNEIHIFTGTSASPFPLPGCPGVDGLITDNTLVGIGTAAASGLVQVSVPVDASSVGNTVLFHAADFTACRISNLSVHTYY